MAEMTASTAASRRAGALGVHSLHRFVFTVPDLEVARVFYTAFGLGVRPGNDARNKSIELRTFGHPQVWAQIYQAGALKKLQYLSFGIFADDEAAFRKRIAEQGLGCEPHALGDGKGLWLRSPDGVPFQLVVADKSSPSTKSLPTVVPPVPPGAGAAPARSEVKPVRPRRLAHVLLYAVDVLCIVKFCEQVLGMRLSDHSGDGIAFVHGVHGSDHHMVAFAKSHAPGLHHSSWDVGSIDEVGLGSEQMRAAGFTRGWGVGRHVLGSNYFYYAKDPWGSFAEYSFNIDYVPHTLDWPAADHPPEDSFYVWGPAPLEEFVQNQEVPA